MDVKSLLFVFIQLHSLINGLKNRDIHTIFYPVWTFERDILTNYIFKKVIFRTFPKFLWGYSAIGQRHCLRP